MIEVGIPFSAEELLSIVPSIEIFRRYCTPFKEVDKPFISEIRNEVSPSACIRLSKLGNYYYRDFGDTSYPYLGAVRYVSIKYNLNYREALRKIYEDFKEGLVYHKQHTKKVFPKTNFDLIIDVRKVPWTKKYLKFWYQFGWDGGLLYHNRIYPIDYFWMDNGSTRKMYSCYYGFCYDLGVDTTIIRKVYQPYAKKDFKFRTNNNGSFVEGTIPENGDLLVITSSLKDAGIFQMCGYNACAPNSESTLLTEELYEDLSARFKRIVTWFDNDAPGIEHANSYYIQYGFDSFYNPEGPKDPSDWVKEYGIENFKKLLTCL